MRRPVQALIALGSNLGDREAFLEGALAALRSTPGIQVRRTSRWVETEPRRRDGSAIEGEPSYLNGVCEVDSDLGARALLERLHQIEADAGRERSVPDAARTLDLDLLFYGDERHTDPDLTVPHPRVELRTFVLEPLSQVAPHRFLPRCRRTVSERLAELNVREGRRRHELSWGPSR